MVFKSKYLHSNIIIFFLFFLSVFIYLYGKGQLTNPSARLDDWEFMINVPNYMPSHGSPWDKTLWEGRWVNFIWSKIAIHFSLPEICIIFFLGYCFLCYNISSIFFENQYAIILSSFLLFLSPVYGDLSLWPATLTPSVWISALFLFIYKSKNNPYLLFLFEPFLIMSYPPIALLCFCIVLMRTKKCKDIFVLCFYFFLVYFLSIITIYSLNYIFHGFWGIKIAEWRHPQKIASLEDAKKNFISTYIGLINVYKEFHFLIYFLLLFLISLIFKPLIYTTKLFFIISFCIFIDFFIPFYTGTEVVHRTIIWPWVIIVINLFLFLDSKNKFIRALSVFLMLYMAVFANTKWNSFYRNSIDRSIVVNHYRDILLTAGSKTIYMCGDVAALTPFKDRPYFDSYMPFVLQILKEDDIYLMKYDNCQNVKTRDLSVLNGVYILKLN